MGALAAAQRTYTAGGAGRVTRHFGGREIEASVPHPREGPSTRGSRSPDGRLGRPAVSTRVSLCDALVSRTSFVAHTWAWLNWRPSAVCAYDARKRFDK